MSDKQQRRMQGVPNQIHLISQDKNHAPESETKTIVRMVRVRDVVVGGFIWSLVTLIMGLGGFDFVDTEDIVSPFIFALGFVLLIDHHNVQQ